MRLLRFFVIAASLVGTIALAPPAQAHKSGPCPIAWTNLSPADTTQAVKRLIRCAEDRWPVPGGARKALSVAYCESRFDPDAYGGGNGGVFQQRLTYWGGRYRAYTRPSWGLGRSVYNARTNVIVSIRMAHGSGWSDWACA